MPAIPLSVIDAARAKMIAYGYLPPHALDDDLIIIAEQLYIAGYREAQASMMKDITQEAHNVLDVDTFVITATAEEALARLMTRVIWNMNNELSIEQLAELTRLAVEVSHEYGVQPQRV